ncbi:protein RRNAD1-like isoform X3 [Zootermopsis nevadensis]|uniref:protein RRNAD1-like isoform X3 n=1 Tax=Zootermopsis nevadensis TaxID=136037 RepID=UPI000B8E6794|nr:protein RRNAD1-like isoform X3 [Zootermopsis nevadensis]
MHNICNLSLTFKMPDKLLLMVNNGLKVVEMYTWLLDSYVLDYFTDCHWNKLPLSWRRAFDTVEPQELGQFLTQNSTFKRKLDMELEASVSKILKDDGFEVNWPVHLSIAVDSRLTASSFTEALKIAFGISGEHFTFGMVGLHPCGDLTPILMHLFVQCPNAKFINIVGCCYMKLTTGVISGFTGYPMSDFISARPHSLSYEAREIACHAIETYCQRLCLGQYDDLKVHCYRAALEKILVKYWPHLRHTMIKSIKHTNNMTFTQYITLAFINLGLEVPVEDLESEETQLDLSQWKRVVIFYTLRLILAPVVETVLLLDRLLYLQELGIRSDLIPVFDPSLSPRNSILIGRK